MRHPEGRNLTAAFALVAVATVVVAGGCGGSNGSAAVDNSGSAYSDTPSDTGNAAPESTDEKFLRLTREQGWGGASDSDLILLGHKVCETLDGGATPRETLYGILQPGVTADEAGSLLGNAVGAYCPSHLSELN
jgi:hypothetical protein